MSDDHYRRGDPETGCGIIVELLLLLIVLAMIGALIFAFKAAGPAS